MTCSLCAFPANARGFCHAHYERWRLGRDMHAPINRTPLERFFAKVDKRPDGCWLWTAATDGDGRYGSVQHNGRVQRAHRVAYEMLVGPVPNDLELDHLCRVTLCVKPAHLEVVTHAENVRRGRAGKRWSERIACKRGHAYDDENTQWATTTRGQVYRACRACGRENTRRTRARACARAAFASRDVAPPPQVPGVASFDGAADEPAPSAEGFRTGTAPGAATSAVHSAG